jgi:hypothetical protein
LDELNVRSDATNVSIASKSAELVELEERIDELSATLRQRVSNSNGNGGDDTDGYNPVLSINAALKTLKVDIRELAFRVELTNEILTGKKLENRRLSYSTGRHSKNKSKRDRHRNEDDYEFVES